MDVKPVVFSTEFSAEDSRIFGLAMNSWAIITYPIEKLAERGIFLDDEIRDMYLAKWDSWNVLTGKGEK